MSQFFMTSRTLQPARGFTRFRALRWPQLAVTMAGMLLTTSAWSQNQPGTLVRLVTSVGAIDIQLMDEQAPRTTANFLSYARSGAYNGSFFHRLVRGFVLQGGGLNWNSQQQPPVGVVPVGASIANEFSATRSNVRATVSMAKVDGNPDSATNQWFINLTNNSANLDIQNGGFTVFAQVLAPGMNTVEALARLPLVNASSCTNLGPAVTAMAQVPMQTTPANCESVGAAHLVQILSVKELPPRHTVADTERVFDFLEAYAPHFFAGSSPATATGNGFVYRFYGAKQTYVAAQDGVVYALAPLSNGQVVTLDTVSSWLAQAAANGY